MEQHTARSLPRRPAVAALTLIGVLALGANAVLASGHLDTTFDGDGIAIVSLGSSDAASAGAIQSDGKIVAVGSDFNPLSGDTDLALARFNSDGTLDTSFDGDGKRVVVTASVKEFGRDAALAPPASGNGPGNIVVVGEQHTCSANISCTFQVAQFLPTGAPDTNFGGGDGIAETDFDTAANLHEYAWAVVVLSDRSIIVGGQARVSVTPSVHDLALAKYSSTGVLDTNFGGSPAAGLRIHALGSGSRRAQITDMVLDSSGKIVATGYWDANDDYNKDLLVARFNSNGDLDTNFGGGDGWVSVTVGSSAEGNAVGIDSQGRIVVAGAQTVSNMPGGFVARFTAAGALDTTFAPGGTDGDGVVSLAGTGPRSLLSLVVLGNDKILAGGRVSGALTVVRYTTDGTLDTTFDGDGTVTESGASEASELAVQSDGKIVALGYTSGASTDFAVVRLNPNGTPTTDTTPSSSTPSSSTPESGTSDSSTSSTSPASTTAGSSATTVASSASISSSSTTSSTQPATTATRRTAAQARTASTPSTLPSTGGDLGGGASSFAVALLGLGVLVLLLGVRLRRQA